MVVIDQRLGDMSGIQVIRQLRQLAPNLPAILLIELSDSKTKEDAAQLGAVTTLYKPVRPSQLHRTLLECLGAPAEPAPARTPPADEPAMAVVHPLRILLVEDNLVNQKVALRILERLGYQPDVAADGRQAVDAVRSHRYDVVLMDVHMPLMDGIDATRQIRAMGEPAGRPHIIAMTAAAMPFDRERCLQAGMDDFLAKPFRMEDVVAVLQKSPPSLQEPAQAPVPEEAPRDAAEAADDSLGQETVTSLYATFGSRDVALLIEVISAYAEDAPRQLAAMQQAAEARDAETLALAAHSLKSASQIINATTSARISEGIEVLARGNRLDEAVAELPALMVQVRRVLDQMAVWLQSCQ